MSIRNKDFIFLLIYVEHVDDMPYWAVIYRSDMHLYLSELEDRLANGLTRITSFYFKTEQAADEAFNMVAESVFDGRID